MGGSAVGLLLTLAAAEPDVSSTDGTPLGLLLALTVTGQVAVTTKAGWPWPDEKPAKRWWEALEEQYADTRQRAKELKAKPKAKAALTKAADVVQELMANAGQADAPPQIDRLADMLSAANCAESLGDTIRLANAARKYAERIRGEMDEEDEVIALMMLN